MEKGFQVAIPDFNTDQLVSELQKRIDDLSIRWYFDHWIIRDLAENYIYGEGEDLRIVLQASIAHFDQLALDRPHLRQAWREYAARHSLDPEARIYFVNHRNVNIWCVDGMALGPTNGGVQGAIEWLGNH